MRSRGSGSGFPRHPGYYQGVYYAKSRFRIRVHPETLFSGSAPCIFLRILPLQEIKTLIFPARFARRAGAEALTLVYYQVAYYAKSPFEIDFVPTFPWPAQNPGYYQVVYYTTNAIIRGGLYFVC